MSIASHMTQCFCHECGVEYWMPTRLNEQCRSKGPNKTFYCPNGHSAVYRESEADKVRRDLERAKQNEAYLEARIKEERERAAGIERQLIAQKGETTKAKKRLANFDAPKGKHLVVVGGNG